MNWFKRKPTIQKQVEAAVTVASNLYVRTIPGGEDADVDLQFCLPDSRYRYLIFCITTVLTAVLAYDEKKEIQPEQLLNACFRVTKMMASEDIAAYFNDPATASDSINRTGEYFQEFSKHWSRWPNLEKEKKNMEIFDLISSMIHSTESNEPVSETDTKRLSALALRIACQLPTMRGAFIEMTH